MLTDNDIYFSEQDDAAAKALVNVGDRYEVKHISFGFDGQVVHSMATHESFVTLFQSASSIECVDEDCSIVKFIGKDNEELETLNTDSKLGSILASNPTLWVGMEIRTRRE